MEIFVAFPRIYAVCNEILFRFEGESQAVMMQTQPDVALIVATKALETVRPTQRTVFYV